MQRISKLTFFYKRLFGPIWVAQIVIAMAVLTLVGRFQGRPPGLMVFVIGLVVAAFGYAMTRWLCSSLMDEVWLDETELVVRNDGHEESVALSGIINVNVDRMMSPPRATLLLRQSSTWGDQISFMPPQQINPFTSSPIVNELISRIDASRIDSTE